MSADKSDAQSISRLSLGILITLATNCLFLANSFIVREYPLYGGELCLCKGILQTAFFAFTACGFYKGKATTTCLPPHAEDTRLRLFVAIYGASNGIMILSGYVALKMIPVSDFMVFCYTSVIFTIVFSACILRSRLTILKVLLCAILLTGVTLVAQPPFLFDRQAQSADEDVTTDNMQDLANQESYYLGMAVSVLAGAGAGLTYVSAKRCEECPKALLMISSGICSLLIALVCPIVDIPNRIFTEPSSIDSHEWILIFGTSIASILGNLLLIPASRIATPIIVNMVRSTELLFAYAVQIIFFGKVPAPLVACGATFVLGSIISMTFVDKIQ